MRILFCGAPLLYLKNVTSFKSTQYTFFIDEINANINNLYFFQNELAVSEFIQNIVETLNSYFKKVVSVFNADYYKFQLRNVCINLFLVFVSFRLKHMYPCWKEPRPANNLKMQKETKRHFAIQNINRPLNSHAFAVSLTLSTSLSRSHATINKSHALSSFKLKS